MNWERIESARQRGRTLLVIAGIAIVFALFLLSEPSFGPILMAGQIPLSWLLTAIGIGGMLVGLAWMWRIYKAPTKHEGAHWRFRDR